MAVLGLESRECTCPVCNKVFIRAHEHLYFTKPSKHKKLFYCSYTCYNKAPKKKGRAR